jgi:hypothetical protein
MATCRVTYTAAPLYLSAACPPDHSPGVHSEQLPAASPELVPAGHSRHVSLTVLSRYMPGWHGLQKLEPDVDTS